MNQTQDTNTNASTPASVDTAIKSNAQPVETQKPQDDFSKRIEMLARQEKKILDEKRRVKEEQESYKRQLESEYEPLKKYKTLEEKLRNKDFSVLKDFGFDYDSYTRTVLNDGDPTPETLVERAKREIMETLESKFKDRDSQLEERRKQEAETHSSALRKNWLTEVSSELSNAKDKYPYLLSQPDASEIVLTLIEESFKGDKPKRLKLEDAAELANNHFKEESKKSITSNLDLYKEFFLESLGIDKEKFDILLKSSKPTSESTKLVPQTKTLTSDSSIVTTDTSTRRMSREESIESLKKLFKSKS